MTDENEVLVHRADKLGRRNGPALTVAVHLPDPERMGTFAGLCGATPMDGPLVIAENDGDADCPACLEAAS